MTFSIDFIGINFEFQQRFIAQYSCKRLSRFKVTGVKFENFNVEK